PLEAGTDVDLVALVKDVDAPALVGPVVGVRGAADEPPHVTQEHIAEQADRQLVARVEIVVRDVFGRIVLAGPEVADAAAQAPVAEVPVDDDRRVYVEALAEALERHEV